MYINTSPDIPYLSKCLDLSFLELRFYSPISDSNLMPVLLAHLSENSNLRDLELTLNCDKSYTLQILDSLQNNYMLKTLRLHDKHDRLDNTKIANKLESFRSKRIAMEIAVNCNLGKFKSLKKKQVETYYPQ